MCNVELTGYVVVVEVAAEIQRNQFRRENAFEVSGLLQGVAATRQSFHVTRGKTSPCT
jgi:hypothetical protein